MLPRVPFLFIRHGQTDWNVEGRMQGKTDVPLNATGLLQAQTAAERLTAQPFDMIVSSDLSRALQTAQIIAEHHQKPLMTDPLLQERSFGRYEGRLTAEVRIEHRLKPEDSITKALPADAEQWPETKARSIQAIRHHLEEKQGQTILFVSHGAFFRALYESLGGPYMEARNATPYRFTPSGTHDWRLDIL